MFVNVCVCIVFVRVSGDVCMVIINVCECVCLYCDCLVFVCVSGHVFVVIVGFAWVYACL